MSGNARNASGELASSAANQARTLSERVRLLEAELSRMREVEAHARVLIDSERKFRMMVERATEGLWALDAKGLTTFANQALAAMLGYSPEAMLGRHLFEFIPEDRQTEVRDRLAMRTQGVGEMHEFPFVHAQGHLVWTLCTASPIEDDQGNYQGALALVLDATEQHRAANERSALNERIVERQKLESLGVLAGGIAHDFNNLLAAIMGHIEIASQEPALGLRSRTALTNALSAAQRAAGLTRQLLDYAGRSQLSLAPLQLGVQTREIIELLRASIPKRVNIELAISDPALTIIGDPDRLQQATINLVINAAEAYGDEPGTVFVRVASEEVGPEGLRDLRMHESVTPGEYVVLEVRDHGKGMDEATLRRVFEPFFTTKARGRGLGLAATLGIVRTHQGHLTVHSAPGAGTTFRLYFARSHEQSPEPVRSAKPAPSAATKLRTLLVVDDEPMVREFAHRLLEAEGYHVLEASSGGEALALLRAHADAIDAMLLDLSMPGMDGDALLSELRSFAPKLPVIVHSGHALEATSERLQRWRIAGVLQKPYRAARLTDMVRHLFESARAS